MDGTGKHLQLFATNHMLQIEYCHGCPIHMLTYSL